MSDIFLGWDVGAWNCDRNPDSRDALCALDWGASRPVLLGNPWRGNLREVLVEREGRDLIDALLEKVGLTCDKTTHVTIAIDTPLAWPKPMIELVTAGTTVVVPAKADENPYLFRTQELALFDRKRRPLSTVRDMIGSQSTKGIHFLRRAKLAATGIGVWSAGSTTAIETYPAAAVAGSDDEDEDDGVKLLTAELRNMCMQRQKRPPGANWEGDVRDAITCAVVAMLHRREPERLEAPGPSADAAEGWIWLPRGVGAKV
jgi:hypothetical protein